MYTLYRITISNVAYYYGSILYIYFFMYKQLYEYIAYNKKLIYRLKPRIVVIQSLCGNAM